MCVCVCVNLGVNNDAFVTYSWPIVPMIFIIQFLLFSLADKTFLVDHDTACRVFMNCSVVPDSTLQLFDGTHLCNSECEIIYHAFCRFYWGHLGQWNKAIIKSWTLGFKVRFEMSNGIRSNSVCVCVCVCVCEGGGGGGGGWVGGFKKTKCKERQQTDGTGVGEKSTIIKVGWQDQALYEIKCKPSCSKISSLDEAIYGLTLVWSLRNKCFGTSSSHFRAIWWFYRPMSRLQDFTRPRGLTS